MEKNIKRADKCSFDNFSSFESMFEAIKLSAKTVRWKTSVLRFLNNVLTRAYRASKHVKNLKDVRKGFIKFQINDRGKTRDISSVHFSERIVQKSLCRKVLYPLFIPHLIYHNGASLKGKGTSFAINELVKHLHKFYHKFGNDGYVLTIDFTKYFDNIDHEILKKYYRKFIFDERLLKYVDDFVDVFGEKGLGLGSETSQLHAILYPNPFDHYIKDQMGIKYYGRYMDDSYILCKDKTEMQEILKKVTQKADELKIILNVKKTQIHRLSQGFTFLKTRFILTSSGKVIKKPCKKHITNMRRKLKRMVKIPEITAKDLWQSYISWDGSMKNKNAYFARQSMRKLVMKLIDSLKTRSS